MGGVRGQGKCNVRGEKEGYGGCAGGEERREFKLGGAYSLINRGRRFSKEKEKKTQH